MKLSIICLNYKNKNLVKYFLAALTRFKFDFEWEIIVVDNNSRDGLADLIRDKFSGVKFVANKRNLGMGAGNNAGIRQSRGQYVLIVNPDVTIKQESIKRMVRFADEHERSGVVAPKILNPDGTRQETCFRWPRFATFLYRRTKLGLTETGRRQLDYYLYKNENMDKTRLVDWVLGGCFMVRRRTLDEVGLFDENFFLFLEDTDLCRRVRQAGWEVWYCPEASAVHLPHRLSAGAGGLKDAFSRLTWIHLISWLKYFWKWRRTNL